MKTLSQSPKSPEFEQDPYGFYEQARSHGSMFHWDEFDMPCAVGYGAANAILRDRRLGREVPVEQQTTPPAHQAGFWKIEDHSMLELEAPRHTRLRGLVLRAFTSRRIAALAPEIETLANELIDRFDGPKIELISQFAAPLPVIIIARLLGVPEDRADDLLAWSHGMVAMYKAGRTLADETHAAACSTAFTEFLNEYVDHRRKSPGDDLISHLIAAEEGGEKLSTDELISTCVLLLNAGHEATVHTLGNGVKTLLENDFNPEWMAEGQLDKTVEEIIRYDPPLHLFTRYAYEDIEVGPHVIPKGAKVAALLGAANRDPDRWEDPSQFNPARYGQTNTSFGAGAHFCLGAPLARLELGIGLRTLFERLPNLAIDQTPQYGPIYPFHGLTTLDLTR